MSIRLAKVEDAEVMDEINRKVLPENYPLEFWTALIESQYTYSYVVEVEENTEKKVVGYILTALDKDNQKRIIGHVYSVGILPEYRRKGYGQRLFKYIEVDFKLRQVPSITLNVRKTNKGAIRFYNKLGYYRAKKVKAYYGKGNDGFLMKKTLDY